MSVGTNDQATKALEWMLEKLAQAKANGYWLDKVSSFSASGGVPAAASRAAPPPASSVSRGELDQAINRATRAEAQVAALTKRVEKLEHDLQALEAVWTRH